MVVPIRAKSPYAFRHNHTGMLPHTHMVIFPARYAYSHEILMVATWHPISAKNCACYFWNRTEMSKEQHIDENFTIMVCPVMKIIDCLYTVITREHNWLFSFRTTTANQNLVRMVTVFYLVTFKNPLPVCEGVQPNIPPSISFSGIYKKPFILCRNRTNLW